MKLADKLEQNEKLNIVIGDFFIKNMGLPSRTVLSNLLFMDFPKDKKNRINNSDSFFQVAQSFLDFGLGGRGSLIKKVAQYYRCGSNKIVSYEKFLFSKQVETMISFDYDNALEFFYSDYVYKVPFEKLKLDEVRSEKMKIALYKCLGDISNESEMLITNQDFRKFTILNHYKEYVNALANEFSTKKTLLLGCDLDNIDFIEYMSFILKLSEKKGIQPIYLVGVDKIDSETGIEFLERFNIEVLEEDIHMFKEKKIQTSEKNSAHDTQIKIFSTIPEKVEDIAEITSHKNIVAKQQEEQNEIQSDVEEVVSEISPKNDKEEAIKFEIIEATVKEEEKENEEISEKEIILDKSRSDLFTIETAPELKFTSLQLYSNPIKFNNIPEIQAEQIIAKIETSSIRVGSEQIFGTKLKLTKVGAVKFLEIRTREFRIKFSVGISPEGKITEEKDYLDYEIFTVINPNRVKNIVELFIGIFSGVPIVFNTPKYISEINLHNRLQMLKFQIIRESENNYQMVSESIPLAEEKKFYSSSLSYYLNYLLWNNLKESTIESWGNFSVDSEISLENCDKLIFIREHELLLKNGKKTVIEKIILHNVKDNLEMKDGKQLLVQKRITIETEIKDI